MRSPLLAVSRTRPLLLGVWRPRYAHSAHRGTKHHAIRRLAEGRPHWAYRVRVRRIAGFGASRTTLVTCAACGGLSSRSRSALPLPSSSWLSASSPASSVGAAPSGEKLSRKRPACPAVQRADVMHEVLNSLFTVSPLPPLSLHPSMSSITPRLATVAMTGAGGYVASALVDLLIRKGYHVRATVRLWPTPRRSGCRRTSPGSSCSRPTCSFPVCTHRGERRGRDRAVRRLRRGVPVSFVG